MKNHFMIDIETTGVNLHDDAILEVGVLELKYKNGFWYFTGNAFEKVLYYPGEPESAFAKKYMSDLYKKCNNQPFTSNYSELSSELRSFLRSCSEEGELFRFMGKNATMLDIPMIAAKGILKPSYYEQVSATEEILKGDIHYQIYELTGAINIACSSTGLDRKILLKLAEKINPTNITLPKGKEHTAIYDCYLQLIQLNGIIAILRNGLDSYKDELKEILGEVDK